MYEALRQAELVEPTATMEEVRAFLERNVAASDAKEFCLMMDRLPVRTGAGATHGERRPSRDSEPPTDGTPKRGAPSGDGDAGGKRGVKKGTKGQREKAKH
jgi:hypothetical protein